MTTSRSRTSGARQSPRVRLAIFDIDGTIFRSSLLIELFNELVRRGVFPRQASLEVERNFVAWLNRKGHYNDYLMKLVKVHYRYQTGCTVRQVEPAIRAVIAWQKDRVYRYTRDLIKELRAKGFYLLAISNSQNSMVQRFAHVLGFDAAIGRALEVVDGIYTGRVLYDGKRFPIEAHLDKVAILTSFLSTHGVNADLKHSIAVGDSEGDIPLLNAVGNPIAFNPSAELAAVAQDRGWQIVVERKDIVYKIHDAQIITVSEPQHVRVPYGHPKQK
ncbi:MAG: HAD family phosphatase [Candidatus Yanofskybacteria bacterium]|nr:HAD family phosphatase [Candidatus Yanofskybacteria bacterium]